MNKLDKQKRAIILLFTYFIILFTPKLKRKENTITYNPDYQITDNTYFATYNNYHIYIGSKEYIKEIYDDNPNNIYIIDNRDSKNPNIGICNSTKITDRKKIIEILKIILEYEKRYPTNWNRSLDAMKKEWLIHNICYYLGLEIARTAEVDLDNDDEANYQNLLTIINALLDDEYYQKETEKIKKLAK